MILESYLKKYNLTLRKFHLISGIPESTIRSINKRDIDKWNIEYFNAISKVIGKSKCMVIKELENMEVNLKGYHNKNFEGLSGRYNLENRRYIGNKNKLMNWISGLLEEYTTGNTFFDVFAGTGTVSKYILPKYNKIILNDFLFSNNVIFKAFFEKKNYDKNKILDYQHLFQEIKINSEDDNYFVDNYGGKFFSEHDAKIIGEIRTKIANANDLNEKERAILLASLIYSLDKIANTVGHYDAYRKNHQILTPIKLRLPIVSNNCNNQIYRKDANDLVRNISADLVYIDPPYNSRQYGDSYHLLENIIRWHKPEVVGISSKMVDGKDTKSEYSTKEAPKVFDDLIKHIKAKYILVSYNNMAKKGNSRSNAKISNVEIINSLTKRGVVEVHSVSYHPFSSGNTHIKNHKELLYLCKITN